jgi:hypothetical protein
MITSSKWEIDAPSINQLNDVDTATVAPSSGNVLTWDGTEWVPSAPSLVAHTIGQHSDVLTTPAPLEGEGLRWDSLANKWVPRNDVGTIAGALRFQYDTTTLIAPGKIRFSANPLQDINPGFIYMSGICISSTANYEDITTILFNLAIGSFLTIRVVHYQGDLVAQDSTLITTGVVVQENGGYTVPARYVHGGNLDTIVVGRFVSVMIHPPSTPPALGGLTDVTNAVTSSAADGDSLHRIAGATIGNEWQSRWRVAAGSTWVIGSSTSEYNGTDNPTGKIYLNVSGILQETTPEFFLYVSSYDDRGSASVEALTKFFKRNRSFLFSRTVSAAEDVVVLKGALVDTQGNLFYNGSAGGVSHVVYKFRVNVHGVKFDGVPIAAGERWTLEFLADEFDIGQVKLSTIGDVSSAAFDGEQLTWNKTSAEWVGRSSSAFTATMMRFRHELDAAASALTDGLMSILPSTGVQTVTSLNFSVTTVSSADEKEYVGDILGGLGVGDRLILRSFCGGFWAEYVYSVSGAVSYVGAGPSYSVPVTYVRGDQGNGVPATNEFISVAIDYVKQGVEVINELADVTAPAPLHGESLTWDSTSSKWIPKNIVAKSAGTFRFVYNGNDQIAPLPSGEITFDDTVLQNLTPGSIKVSGVCADSGSSPENIGIVISGMVEGSLLTVRVIHNQGILEAIDVVLRYNGGATFSNGGYILPVRYLHGGTSDSVPSGSFVSITVTPPGAIGDLTDVEVATTPADGELLTWDSATSKWIPMPDFKFAPTLFKYSVADSASVSPPTTGQVKFGSSGTPPFLLADITSLTFNYFIWQSSSTPISCGALLDRSAGSIIRMRYFDGNYLEHTFVVTGSSTVAFPIVTIPVRYEIGTVKGGVEPSTGTVVSFLIEHPVKLAVSDLKNTLFPSEPVEGEVLTWEPSNGGWNARNMTHNTPGVFRYQHESDVAIPADGKISFNPSGGVDVTSITQIRVSDKSIASSSGGEVSDVYFANLTSGTILILRHLSGTSISEAFYRIDSKSQIPTSATAFEFNVTLLFGVSAAPSISNGEFISMGIVLPGGLSLDSLANLSDTTITAPSDGQIIRYSSGTGTWVNVDGTLANLGDVADTVTSSAKAGDVLTRAKPDVAGSQWVARAPPVAGAWWEAVGVDTSNSATTTASGKFSKTNDLTINSVNYAAYYVHSVADDGFTYSSFLSSLLSNVIVSITSESDPSARIVARLISGASSVLGAPDVFLVALGGVDGGVLSPIFSPTAGVRYRVEMVERVRSSTLREDTAARLESDFIATNSIENIGIISGVNEILVRVGPAPGELRHIHLHPVGQITCPPSAYDNLQTVITTNTLHAWFRGQDATVTPIDVRFKPAWAPAAGAITGNRIVNLHGSGVTTVTSLDGVSSLYGGLRLNPTNQLDQQKWFGLSLTDSAYTGNFTIFVTIANYSDPLLASPNGRVVSMFSSATPGVYDYNNNAGLSIFRTTNPPRARYITDIIYSALPNSRVEPLVLCVRKSGTTLIVSYFSSGSAEVSVGNFAAASSLNPNYVTFGTDRFPTQTTAADANFKYNGPLNSGQADASNTNYSARVTIGDVVVYLSDVSSLPSRTMVASTIFDHLGTPPCVVSNTDYPLDTTIGLLANVADGADAPTANGNLLTWNLSTGEWQASLPPTLGALPNVADAADAPTANGNILTWNSTSSEWQASLPPTLGALSNVADGADAPAANGYLLTWNSTASEWRASLPPTLGALSNVADAADAPTTNGQVLTWNSTSSQWAAAALPASEVATAANVGVNGQGIYKQKVGSEFQFKRIMASTTDIVTVTANGADEVKIGIDPKSFGSAVGYYDVKQLTGALPTNYTTAPGSYAIGNPYPEAGANATHGKIYVNTTAKVVFISSLQLPLASLDPLPTVNGQGSNALAALIAQIAGNGGVAVGATYLDLPPLIRFYGSLASSQFETPARMICFRPAWSISPPATGGGGMPTSSNTTAYGHYGGRTTGDANWTWFRYSSSTIDIALFSTDIFSSFNRWWFRPNYIDSYNDLKKIADVADVSSTPPTNGQTLTWVSASNKWTPVTPGAAATPVGIGDATDVQDAVTANGLDGDRLVRIKSAAATDSWQARRPQINRGSSWIISSLTATSPSQNGRMSISGGTSYSPNATALLAVTYIDDVGTNVETSIINAFFAVGRRFYITTATATSSNFMIIEITGTDPLNPYVVLFPSPGTRVFVYNFTVVSGNFTVAVGDRVFLSFMESVPHALDFHTDVDTSNLPAENGQFLMWDTDKWVRGPAPEVVSVMPRAIIAFDGNSATATTLSALNDWVTIAGPTATVLYNTPGSHFSTATSPTVTAASLPAGTYYYEVSLSCQAFSTPTNLRMEIAVDVDGSIAPGSTATIMSAALTTIPQQTATRKTVVTVSGGTTHSFVPKIRLTEWSAEPTHQATVRALTLSVERLWVTADPLPLPTTMPRFFAYSDGSSAITTVTAQDVWTPIAVSGFSISLNTDTSRFAVSSAPGVDISSSTATTYYEVEISAQGFTSPVGLRMEVGVGVDSPSGVNTNGSATTLISQNLSTVSQQTATRRTALSLSSGAHSLIPYVKVTEGAFPVSVTISHLSVAVVKLS